MGTATIHKIQSCYLRTKRNLLFAAMSFSRSDGIYHAEICELDGSQAV